MTYASGRGARVTSTLRQLLELRFYQLTTPKPSQRIPMAAVELESSSAVPEGLTRCCVMESMMRQGKSWRRQLTGLLLLNSQLSPAALHPVAQSHPELGLLLHRHALPSLLDVGQRRVRDGVRRGGAVAEGGGCRLPGGTHKRVAEDGRHGGRDRGGRCSRGLGLDAGVMRGDGSN